ncbi:MAG: PA0069 family radical SAM protein [Leptospiraceae bacterium]|nr:PA0069 family radical SAM protein [Leptospiraceae bacterium]
MQADRFHTPNRGATINPEGRFESQSYQDFQDGWEIPEEKQKLETIVYTEYAKSIITRNDSPDVPTEKTLNPYRGCEHGCIYCYARPSHSFLNLSPGLDFETKLFAKKNAAELLDRAFQRKNYICRPISIGSNTDPYQPIERKWKLTRQLLEVFLKWQHPVAIITKSSLISRDLDILSALAKKNLLRVSITLSSANPDLLRIMEPRAASFTRRISTLKALTEAGIPTGVMTAPIIPNINDSEMEYILNIASRAGAVSCGYVLIRLPYELKDIFKDWLQQHFPEKYKKVMSLIKQTRGGKEYDSDFSQRMTGTGAYAELLLNRFRLARKKYGFEKELKPMSTELFQNDRQPCLFP